MPAKDYNNYMKEYMLRRYHKRRLEAIAYLGGTCAVCGTTSNLEFDHIDASEKSFPIGKMWSVNDIALYKELDKCQLLCKSHHEEKTLREEDYRHRMAV